MIRFILSLYAAIALSIIGATIARADAPAGASATACDSTAFVPVMSADGLRVLYWNNPTCPASGGDGQSLAAVDPCAPTIGSAGRKS